MCCTCFAFTDYCLYIVSELTAAQQCPEPSAPDHIGDTPDEGVITFGIILPLRSPGPDNECGSPNPAGLARLEALVWAINNARSVFGNSGLKIGMLGSLHQGINL